MIKDIIEKMKSSLSKIPTISKKSSESITFFLLQHREILKDLAQSTTDASEKIRNCEQCGNLTEDRICKICKNRADARVLCVVADVKDLVKIERANFKGKYHILRGKLDPLAGIEAEHLTISKLMQRIKDEKIEELILALDADVEGNLTIECIKDLVDIKVSRLALGIQPGSKLEFVDSEALQSSLRNREEIQ